MLKRIGHPINNYRGFTLLELVIVLLIIGIVVAIAVPLYNASGKEAKKKACQANLRTLDEIVTRYYADNDEWPTEEIWQYSLRRSQNAPPIRPDLIFIMNLHTSLNVPIRMKHTNIRKTIILPGFLQLLTPY